METQKPSNDKSESIAHSAAVGATSQVIAAGYAATPEDGLGLLPPPEEIIAEPNPSDYVSPGFLTKTSPELVSSFQELLDCLRDLNTRFTGERTLDAQAYLSLTGEHEELEEAFLAWCRRYFATRGSLDQLNPQVSHDPWRLFLKCMREFHQLLEIRLNAAGTINSSVLNLSQRYMHSAFAFEVLKLDLKTFKRTGRDRFGSESHRQLARNQVRPFGKGVNDFSRFLKKMTLYLPMEYQPRADQAWRNSVQGKIERRAEDLVFLRPILCVGDHDKTTVRQLAPDLWGRLKWYVHHGRAIATLLTGSAETEIADSQTKDLINFRRDGLMCHGEYPWIRVDPNFKPDERYSELAVNWFLLETFTDPLIAAWDRLDPAPILSRGFESDATDEETTAALVVALAEHNPVPAAEVVEPRRRLPRIKLNKLERILVAFFNCKCSQGKGSERKVFRPGYKQFTFGCHGFDRLVHPSQLRKCLSKLGVTAAEFISAAR